MSNGEKKGNLKVKLSAGDNKIKYYNCDGNNCIFEISDGLDETNDKEGSYSEEIIKENVSGTINITAYIENHRTMKKDRLQGVKVNLYKINGLSPILVSSKESDANGNIVFSSICEGSYRIIEIVDKRYFKRPQYIKWNEINIDESNTNHNISIINSLK